MACATSTKKNLNPPKEKKVGGVGGEKKHSVFARDFLFVFLFNFCFVWTPTVWNIQPGLWNVCYLGSLRNLWVMQFPLKWARWQLANCFCSPPCFALPPCLSLFIVHVGHLFFSPIPCIFLHSCMATLLTLGQRICPWTACLAIWAFDPMCLSSGSSPVKIFEFPYPHPCYVLHAIPVSCACKSCFTNSFSLP